MMTVYGITWEEGGGVSSPLSPQEENAIVSTKLKVENMNLIRENKLP